jgi:FKBP-type peptidyl-prolyl cis-trans isomerase SlyD
MSWYLSRTWPHPRGALVESFPAERHGERTSIQEEERSMTATATVKNDCVVLMHYVLTDSEGTVIDRSPEGNPLPYLHGHQNIVPGLEVALTGAEVGETKNVTVSPEEGYGVREEELVLSVPRDQFPGDAEPKVGMMVGMETDQGHTVPVRITDVSDERIELDANHELAGVTLHFEVRIDSVRPASAEELAHGHVHGPGGHHH